MWNHPRPVRTEIISVDTAALARHAFAKTDFACIQALPKADGTTLLTIIAAAEWKNQDGVAEYWFRSRRDATRILDEMASLEAMPWVASRVEGGVLIEASNLDAVVAECLRWQPAGRLVSAAEINAYIASVKVELDRSLVRLQVTGAMKALNREYKRLRTSPRAEGEKFPNLKTWLTGELEQQLVRQLMVPAGL